MPLEHPRESHVQYCCCDIYVGSAIEVSDDDGAHTLSDDTKEAWEALFVPSSSSHEDPNRAPTEVAKDGITQAPPLLSKLIQGHVDHRD